MTVSNICGKWVHGKCSGLKGYLYKSDGKFVCKTCKATSHVQNRKGVKEAFVLSEGVMVEGVENLYHQ